ncbi:MAG: dolichyl-phosphate beta-glucosyltransferase [Vicinamibacterales bacterium]
MPSLVTVVVPAFNEARSIVTTLGELRAYFEAKPYDYEIIVAADGTDGTREIVTGLARTATRLRVIGGPERRGKGRGIRQAVGMARGDVIGFVDADNKTPITEFDRFEPYLIDGWDVVLGSRGLRESRVERLQPWFRRLGSKGFGVFMHAAVGLNDIVDTQCGFKFFQRPVALDLFRRQRIDGYMFDVEILYLATKRGCRIAQVPVRWRDDGDSRLDLVRGNIRNFFDVLQIRFTHYENPPVSAVESGAADY